MNHLRNFLNGSSNNDDDNDQAIDHNQRNGRHNNNQQSYGYGNNNRTSKKLQYNDNHNDDLYLSDDDDWGMSAFSATQTTTRDNDNDDDHRHYDGSHYDGERRSSSAFWDQSSSNNAMGEEILGVGGSGSGSRGLQEWEREAMMRDSLDDDAFEMGKTNDDYYHDNSDHHGKRSQRDTTQQQDAYDEVQEDIRSLETDEEGGIDDNASSASSSKEEVVTAYRDYLKSIRDGGFESYLDKEEVEGGGMDNANIQNSNSAGNDYHHEDEALERVLDIEEERATSSIYGDMYGVHDMRSSTNDEDTGNSPYSAWRAKAKALLRQEQERERGRAASPSRQILDRFRRKRSSNSNGNNTTSTSSPQQEQKYGYDHLEKLYSYRPAVMQHPRFRGACIGMCLVLSLAVGLSYYGGEKRATTTGDEGTPVLAIPPETSSVPNEIDQSKNNYKNPQLGPSDAIINALQTFDPTWYDRRSGWEGITFTNAVDFCATHENRVPCPYEIYCNEAKEDGPGAPYRGNRPNGEQWSPISNGANQWVQVGGMFTCQRYTDLHDDKKPDWGITGISTEHEHGAGGITQNVMCCVDVYQIGSLDPFTEWGKQGLGDEDNHVEADDTKETTDSAVVNIAEDSNAESEKNPNEGNVAIMSEDNVSSQKREKAVIAAFQPIWFSSAHGWSGTSYEDAILFCESYNNMVLCPYAGYCPNGRGNPALPGSMVTELDGEEWVPANGPMNTWVQIGTIDAEENTRCTLHHDILGERPQWGIDGTRTDVKHHIMCCLM
mmetsp:Transcript_32610/g.68553  ORF Transcript_32610/g.68553 Transcript_32610/m.68553 type:complete len:774 (+) Transcript_32610:210-2531(+)|eukprot:CAMPEP_0172316044 /NCGR_PEP_ID=MMETSP1058-20130122/27068_1 /TAXON_ID=83371 /ORGANISM="Detonula confervacea, Strain CCMP 353" /LENGTH=773 /DNA_ID=CAMNT_0013030265 /DNA_START=206 /DNA_END=2527 /DNA_ORIENTATION=-